MSTAFIFGCNAPVHTQTSAQEVLDPCNCSSYYVLVTDPKPQRQLRICPGGELWSYVAGECRSLESVVSTGVCNRKAPWDRCEQSTPDATGDTFRLSMESKCVKEGRYDPSVAGGTHDRLSFFVPEEAQLANIGLVVASFVAGCVITLVLVAIILTICGLPTVRLPRKLQGLSKVKTTTKNSKRTKVSKKSSKRAGLTMGEDNVSVTYEDIDDEDNLAHSSPQSSMHTTRVITTTQTNTTSYGNPSPTIITRQQADFKKPPSKPPPLPKQSSSPGPRFETNRARQPPPGPPPAKSPPKRVSGQTQSRAALFPPRKKTPAEQQTSVGYIHPT